MGLNTRGIYHPRYTPHIARVDEGAMTCRISVLRRDPNYTPSTDDWDYEAGAPATSKEFVTICESQARVAVQSTWSAQGYLFGDQTTVMQAARFNLPFARVREGWKVDGEEPEFRDEDRIMIEETFFPHLEPIKPFIYVVRNMLINDTDAQWTIVTDANLKSRRSW